VSAARKPQLSDSQQFAVERVRELITRTPQEIVAENPEADRVPGGDYAYAWGRLKPDVQDLLAIVEELTGGAR
jgi:hypothetical protein